MGFFDYVTDIYASLSVQTADAERASAGPEDASGEQTGPVKGGASTKSPASGSDEESDEEAEANAKDAKDDDEDEGAAKAGDDDEEEGGDDEEEEEEEPEDLKPKFEEECMKTRECAPLKHHYDECAERVTSQQEEHGKAHEDCVEEFFHLMHCATQCAAPKLFRALK